MLAIEGTNILYNLTYSPEYTNYIDNCKIAYIYIWISEEYLTPSYNELCLSQYIDCYYKCKTIENTLTLNKTLYVQEPDIFWDAVAPFLFILPLPLAAVILSLGLIICDYKKKENYEEIIDEL